MRDIKKPYQNKGGDDWFGVTAWRDCEDEGVEEPEISRPVINCKMKISHLHSKSMLHFKIDRMSS